MIERHESDAPWGALQERALSLRQAAYTNRLYWAAGLPALPFTPLLSFLIAPHSTSTVQAALTLVAYPPINSITRVWPSLKGMSPSLWWALICNHKRAAALSFVLAIAASTVSMAVNLMRRFRMSATKLIRCPSVSSATPSKGFMIA